MKKKYIKRKKWNHQKIAKSAWNCFGFSNFPSGKYTRKAIFLIGYGAGIKNIQKSTKLSLRQIKVLMKTIHMLRPKKFHDEIQYFKDQILGNFFVEQSRRGTVHAVRSKS